jgi:DNA-binding transcriptional LysR family regulator
MRMRLSDRIGRRMKLQDVHVLMTVVQAGSMRKAAAQLNTTQPSVSRSIAELEDAVGVRLLDRKPQGVEPTPYGRALLHGGIAMFDELRQAVKNIDFLADPTSGEVRIGCNAIVTQSFVSSVIDRLSRRYPRIVIHLMAGQTDATYRTLNERNIDLVIARRFGPIADEGLDHEFLFDDPLVVVAGAQSSWARRRRIVLADLMNEPWVLPPPDSAAGLLISKAFRASDLDYPRATVVSVSPEARLTLLPSGRFLTIAPASPFRFSSTRSEIKVLPVKLPFTRLPIEIVTLKNRTLSPVAQLFIKTAHEVATPLAKQK